MSDPRLQFNEYSGQLMLDIKNACEHVANAVIAGCVSIKEAWDSLDPGLKQWIVIGLSVAASVAIPGIGGILVSCVIDGTFVDMLKAISTGDWATVGMCALNFVPGMKGATGGIKAILAGGGVAGGLGLAAKKVLGKAAKAGASAGKKIDVYRYVGMSEAKQIRKTGTIMSKSGRGTFVTTYKTGSVTDVLAKVKPTSSDIPVARAHARISLEDFKLQPLSEKDIVDPSVSQYLLGEGPRIKCLDLVWLGP